MRQLVLQRKRLSSEIPSLLLILHLRVTRLLKRYVRSITRTFREGLVIIGCCRARRSYRCWL